MTKQTLSDTYIYEICTLSCINRNHIIIVAYQCNMLGDMDVSKRVRVLYFNRNDEQCIIMMTVIIMVINCDGRH